MGQAIFFAVLILTLFAGAFAYYAPKQKPVDPMKFMLDSSGLSSEESINHTKTQELNMTTNKGLVQIRRQMDELADEQSKFLDTIRDQQQVLENTSKDAAAIMEKAQESSDKTSIDMLRLKELTSQMQDQQRLLVSHGQALISLNDRLTESRQLVRDQIDMANINTETSLGMLQQHYSSLKDQAAGFFDQVSQHNQEVSDQIAAMQEHLHDMAQNAASNNTAQQDNAKEHIQRMMDKEHENMVKLAESEERSKNLLQNAQENLENSREVFNDTLQRSEDLMDKERQKAQDQQEILQQRVADQMQRIQDQRDK